MRSTTLAAILLCLLAAACSSPPVNLSQRASASIDRASGRPLEARGCGFQILGLIPIRVMSRFERAYELLLAKAGADALADVEIQESWTYGYAFTVYCTTLRAKAYKRLPGA